MKERPIIFSTPMVQAIQKGHKTMTRRILRIQPPDAKDWKVIRLTDSTSKLDKKNIGKLHWGLFDSPTHVDQRDFNYFKFPYGDIGDILWVRETFMPTIISNFNRRISCIYKASVHESKVQDYRWHPSIHMPREHARLFLEITEIKVERLHDITRGDCMSEGCPFPNMADGPDPISWFTDLWNSINGPSAWEANPWVWVISFKPINHSLTTDNSQLT